MFTEAGGSDEFQGNVDYTFIRPDGTPLGTQGKTRNLVFCFVVPILSVLCGGNDGLIAGNPFGANPLLPRILLASPFILVLG
jgi:hypothetical protein